MTKRSPEYPRLGVLDVPLRLRVICNLVEVLSRLHLHEEASQVVEPAIRISADEGGYFLYGQLCHTAGIVFESLGKYAEALQYSERAINFFEAVGNPEMAIASQLVKGISLRKLGRLEESKAVSSAVIERTQSPGIYPSTTLKPMQSSQPSFPWSTILKAASPT